MFAQFALLLADDTKEVVEVASGTHTWDLFGIHIVAAIVFSIIGITVLAGCFWLMEKLTPFSIVKEIEEHQNTSLAIVMGAVVIAMALIIAAAIQG